MSVKPTIHLYRGGTQSWMPSWTTSSPSAPEITDFLAGLRIKEAGNYAIDEYNLTLKNVTGEVVGVFTDTSRETHVRAKEYFKLVVDDGNVSKEFYGYFGSYDSRYTEKPPNTVTFRGKGLEIETTWRTISVDYNYSTTLMNASDALTHMYQYPDDAPDGSHPLEFILNISGTGLNEVVPESNFARQHPNIFKATAIILQRQGYEQKLVVNVNGSKILEMFPTGVDYHSPNISFVAKGVEDLANNAVRIRSAIDYDDLANIMGVWAQKITRIPVVNDEWTDDPFNNWNDSAWNTSDASFPALLNFSVRLQTFPSPTLMGGFVSSKAVYVGNWVTTDGPINMTVGVTLQFPSYSQSSNLQFDELKATKLRFQLGIPYIMDYPFGPLEVYILLRDGSGNVIRNVRVVKGLFGRLVPGGPNRCLVTTPDAFAWFDVNVNQSTRAVNASKEDDGTVWDWYNVVGINFSFDDVKSISWFANGNTSYLRFYVDHPRLDVNFEVNPREQTSLLPLAVSQNSIDLYQRRFKPLEDNRVLSIADALAYQSSELVKYDKPVKRLSWRTTDALHAEQGRLVTVDCPVYGLNANANTHVWRVLQVQHDWQHGSPWFTSPDIVWPASPGSPSQSLRQLRLTSLDPEEQLAALLEDLRDRVDTLPRGEAGAGVGYMKVTTGTPSGGTIIQSGQITSSDLAQNIIDVSKVDFIGDTIGKIPKLITGGVFDNLRISESSILQHEAAINHDALTNFVIAEHLSLPNTIPNVLNAHGLTEHVLGTTVPHDALANLTERNWTNIVLDTAKAVEWDAIFSSKAFAKIKALLSNVLSIGSNKDILDAITVTGRLTLPGQGAGAGLLIGGDIPIYRIGPTMLNIGNAAYNIGIECAAQRIQIGNRASAWDVVLQRGTANRLDLASGDSFNIVSGSMLAGAVEILNPSRHLKNIAQWVGDLLFDSARVIRNVLDFRAHSTWEGFYFLDSAGNSRIKLGNLNNLDLMVFGPVATDKGWLGNATYRFWAGYAHDDWHILSPDFTSETDFKKEVRQRIKHHWKKDSFTGNLEDHGIGCGGLALATGNLILQQQAEQEAQRLKIEELERRIKALEPAQKR